MKETLDEARAEDEPPTLTWELPVAEILDLEVVLVFEPALEKDLFLEKVGLELELTGQVNRGGAGNSLRGNLLLTRLSAGLWGTKIEAVLVEDADLPKIVDVEDLACLSSRRIVSFSSSKRRLTNFDGLPTPVEENALVPEYE